MTPIIFSSGIKKIPNLSNFLKDNPTFSFENSVVGWGFRPTANKARDYAAKHNLRYIALEDGFLRSIGLGVDGYPPFSLVVDDVGIYYAAEKSSRLEKLIADCTLNDEQAHQSYQAMALIREWQLSKYNHAPCEPVATEHKNQIILVIDQTFGDMAVQYGLADENSFCQMLQAALQENSDAEIWVKTHPDVIAGKKRGYLTELLDQPRVRIISQDINPPTLLSQVDKVYCVTSQMGFEALLQGKEVVTFGVPWFAGWGLTDDRHPFVTELITQQRRNPRTLNHVFYAAYFQYSRYINPFTGEAGDIFDVIHYLNWVKHWQSVLVGDFYCIGLSLWKKTVLKPFFHLPNCRLHFVRSLAKFKKIQLDENVKLLLWGQGKSAFIAYAEENNIPVWRMEDGFIRSVGLGSNLVAPLSLVVDPLGIYFNPQQPSQLESILQNTAFSEKDEDLARQIQQELIQANIGKYNVGSAGFVRPNTDKKVLLVPGQVEDDASIRFGSPQCQSNLTLLQQVRQSHPNTYIIYKPHPDVLSGNRKGHIAQEQALTYADQIVTEANILDCIQAVDEVHTMTSLAGFEALLRGKTVYCYGSPFYAHWGLTVDAYALPRRSKRLTLRQLIAGTLLYYPLYLNPNTRQLTDARTAIDILLAQKNQLKDTGLYKSWLGKKFGKYDYFIRTFLLK
ncbi:capsular polysaccharide biosynthesis protein [Avibacterium sp. 21-586]|uniref:capsular polysaccharide biosynthesis protein n=1 Tax=Avibacterium sp. 21-586 TaxID=2911534 RepID=UPI002245DD41|nr:capsular polysaccharide biosynthesis protein [Avibacterium sp. 21-586]MCW9710255.1 capsular polysaccharide biosynthesis protein [Avibacterium sp. 21-586]